MKLNPYKLIFAAALFSLLAAGMAMPAAALAAPAAIQLPSITWPWESETESSVAAESIAPGDYASTMTVGQTQQLSPTVLPENTTDTLCFVSEDETIATVDEGGVVQALSAGSVRIAATAGGVATYYTITVQTDTSTWVSEMDITLSASQILVDGTATVSIQVLPSGATNTDHLVLTSSDPSIATVNSFGKVTGIAPGTAVITATCDNVSASAKITVVSSASSTVSTESISLNTTYLVLKPGSTVALKATVTPSNASQSLTYKTNDSSVAVVSATGVITAMGTGATSIIVSNGTASALVSVIVNQTATAPADDSNGGGASTDEPGDAKDPVVQAIGDAAGTEVTLAQSDVPTLTSDMLNALRTSGKTLVLTADNYTLCIDGAQINNTANELDTALTFETADNGVEFGLNSAAGTLPGDVEITLTGAEADYQRLYLYNSATEKWQYLNSYSDGVIDADTAGRYLLTNETLSFIQINWYFLGAAGVVLLVIVVAYIVLRKRYWFW